MVGAIAFALAILLHWCPSSPTTVLAYRAARRSIKPGGGNKTVEGCPASCGNLTFDYPFGIGPECSRGRDFSLICHDDAAYQPPKLFLRDGITQVVKSIEVYSDGYDDYPLNSIHKTSIWRVVPMKSGVRVYNISLEPPGRSFSRDHSDLNITGCDLDVYWVDQVTTTLSCSTRCHNEITEMAARHNCTGIGCCVIDVSLKQTYHGDNVQKDFRLSIAVHGRHQSSRIGTTRLKRTSLLRERITVSSDDATLNWSIVDEPNCLAAKKNHKNYACISKNSYCHDQGITSSEGYLCLCNRGYTGNAYIRDGCTNDREYNPNQTRARADCTRQCGNISVQFPFGLEDGCFARKEFRLSCTNATSSGILNMEGDSRSGVIGLDANEGTIKFTNLDHQMDSLYTDVITSGDDLFVSHDVSTSLQWVVANLSCTEAKQNISGYACVSINSSCVEVNAFSGLMEFSSYIGYRCKCPYGFKGNPYIQNGCHDVDECLQQGICKGRVCGNIEGGFTCTECPRNTEYDPTKNQCTRKKQQLLFIGIIIGLSGGFGILLLSFVALFLYRRWKKNVQNQLQKNHYLKNLGLLLEQISPEKTNIFSLKEIEKATNNFDPARIIGKGGHGIVYKGILSNQHVVAVKKSLVIEYSEIKEFINEVAILSEINHRNIVKLFGCCLESEVPLLVYDHISNGSLSQALHAESRNDVSLVWDDYIRIATEAAGALSYLHSDASISVFHRDVKSANILLDENYTAKVSDFGASRLVPVDQTHIVTNVQGTIGYLDPEYLRTRKLNEKSDVYSFGVVLLELLVRKKPAVNNNIGGIESLSYYFFKALKKKEITDIVDSKVAEEATKEEIISVASLAEMCLRLHGEERPTMKQVEMELQILRTKRVSSCQSKQQNKIMLRRASNQRCSSLEKEFMESITLPR